MHSKGEPRRTGLGRLPGVPSETASLIPEATGKTGTTLVTPMPPHPPGNEGNFNLTASNGDITANEITLLRGLLLCGPLKCTQTNLPRHCRGGEGATGVPASHFPFFPRNRCHTEPSHGHLRGVHPLCGPPGVIGLHLECVARRSLEYLCLRLSRCSRVEIS